MIIDFSFVLHEHTKRLVLHLQVDNFSAVEQFLTIEDAIAVKLFISLVLNDGAEAM